MGVNLHHILMRLNKNLLHLRLWRDRSNLFVRKYANLNERLQLDETGKVKLILDPKIEEIQDKLIYSDYIERKRLKYGYVKNKLIERKFKLMLAAENIKKVMTEPNYSIALKYMKDNDTDEDTEPIESEPEDLETEEKPPKLLYRPYSVTDKYETTEIKDENADQISEPKSINENYLNLYESYIAAKNDPKLCSSKIKSLQTQIHEMEMQRPIDRLSNIPKSWMTDYEQYNDDEEADSWISLYGTSDHSIPVSSIPCGGCGAALHCQDAAIPGYLPTELFVGLENSDLKNTICQRCHFMKFYNTTLEVTVSPELYPRILQQIKIKQNKVAVIMVTDVTDFPCSIWPNLPQLLGKTTPLFVVGNKVDLLPKDCRMFPKNVEESLKTVLMSSGFQSYNIKSLNLISAKTGYGVERLIHQLHKHWEYKGDIYMIGCTNVGKSTLFNTLLQSDYCKIQAVDLIQRATVSPWPGTTLNLLKFPILNPVRWRLYLRTMRRKFNGVDEVEELDLKKAKRSSKHDIQFATLQERVERTFPRIVTDNPIVQEQYKRSQELGKFGINERDPVYRGSRWCFDTPGVIHPDQVLHLLTTEELLLTIPKNIISPRSFLFKPGQTMFLAGLGRIDFIDGRKYVRITVFASDQLPVNICLTEDADYLYDKLLLSDAFSVPVNDPERLKIWPKLESKEFSMEGISTKESVADILLSSAGWVAMTPSSKQKITIRVWTPEGRGIHMRMPAMLSKSITLRGARMKGSSAYQLGRQVYVPH